MYGIGKTWADALRQLEGGRLKSTLDQDQETLEENFKGKDFPAVNDIRLPLANPPPPADHYLKNVNRFFRKPLLINYIQELCALMYWADNSC